MKHWLLFVLLFFSVSCARVHYTPQTDRRNDNLNGEVRVLREYFYNVFRKDNFKAGISDSTIIVLVTSLNRILYIISMVMPSDSTLHSTGMQESAAKSSCIVILPGFLSAAILLILPETNSSKSRIIIITATGLLLKDASEQAKAKECIALAM